MKTYIIGVAMFLVMLFFPLQFVTDQTNHYRRTMLNNIVETHIQEARKQGYFTPDIIHSLKDDIQDKLYIDTSDILVDVTTTPKYRTEKFNPNEMIEYKVAVPIDEIIAMGSFFGISDSDNSYFYTVDGAVSSERLP